MENLKQIIESLLFVSDEPLPVDRIKKVIPEAETGEIREAIQSLTDDYDNNKSGIMIREVAKGYQMRTRPDYRDWIKLMLQPSPVRFSRAALETLAIIAYKQPIIRSDIENIRGVDSGGVIRMLLDKKLIRILGRKEIPGRPLIYATTKQFLEVFDLKDLKDLPSPKEIEILSRESAEAVAGGIEAVDPAEPQILENGFEADEYDHSEPETESPHTEEIDTPAPDSASDDPTEPPHTVEELPDETPSRDHTTDPGEPKKDDPGKGQKTS